MKREDLVEIYNQKDYSTTFDIIRDEINIVENFHYTDKDGDHFVKVKVIKDLSKYKLIITLRDYMRHINRIGLLINNNEVFVIDFLGGGYIRPYLEELNRVIKPYSEVYEATDTGLKIIGKAWHIYLKELTKARELSPNCTFLAYLRIPLKDLEK